MKTCSFIDFFWLMACVLCLVSCDEENDFISGPTASSTMISGVARTADGTPLAGVKVSVDYNESVWLGQQTTRHKAEGITDKDGNYRISSCVTTSCRTTATMRRRHETSTSFSTFLRSQKKNTSCRKT